ncbi:hypothetical protein V6N13_011569 [Hibiscus sabdariffa]
MTSSILGYENPNLAIDYYLSLLSPNYFKIKPIVPVFPHFSVWISFHISPCRALYYPLHGVIHGFQGAKNLEVACIPNLLCPRFSSATLDHRSSRPTPVMAILCGMEPFRLFVDLSLGFVLLICKHPCPTQ